MVNSFAPQGVTTGMSPIEQFIASLLGIDSLTGLGGSQLQYMSALGNLTPQGIFSGLGGGPTLGQQQLTSNMQQFAQNYNLQGQELAQQAALAREEMARLIQQSQQDFGLQRQLGLGSLDLSRDRLDLEERLGLGNLDLGQGTLRLNRELGRRELALGEDTLTQNTRLRERDQTLTGQNMLAARATRQLAAPSGNVIPSLQPILNRSRI